MRASPGTGTAATSSAALGPGGVLTTCSLSARCGTTRERGGPRSTQGGARLLTSSTELALGATQPAARFQRPCSRLPRSPIPQRGFQVSSQRRDCAEGPECQPLASCGLWRAWQPLQSPQLPTEREEVPWRPLGPGRLLQGSSAHSELQLGFQGSSVTQQHTCKEPSALRGLLSQHRPQVLTDAVTPPLSLRLRPEYL